MDPEGGRRSPLPRPLPPPPPKKKKSQKYWVFSNTCPDPMKITKLPSQHSVLGHHQNARETPFTIKWHFACGSMMSRLEWYFDLNKPKKTFVKVGPPLTKLSGSVHGKVPKYSWLAHMFPLIKVIVTGHIHGLSVNRFSTTWFINIVL